jgi:hypothetical protein
MNRALDCWLDRKRRWRSTPWRAPRVGDLSAIPSGPPIIQAGPPGRISLAGWVRRIRPSRSKRTKNREARGRDSFCSP